MDDRPDLEPGGGEEHPPVAATPYERPVERVSRKDRNGRGSRGGWRMFATALLGGIIGAAIVGGGVLYAWRTMPAPEATESAVDRREDIVTQPLEEAAAKVLPSVVNVAIETPIASGIGSGVVIRSDGYILTNNHVVDGATSVTVRLGTTDYKAQVVGTDPTSDLAVIKVSKTGLIAATLGDPASLQVGETVLAIGSPFGLDKTVTSGIVSALHRSDLEQGSTGLTAYTDLIQTDAAINPGNSGGALADLSGEVVGVNTLIESPSGQLGAGQSAGIGFAIPIDYAKSVADQIIAGKKVTHPFLGVSTVSVTPLFAEQNGLSVTSGALVQDVTSGSPAAAAGIKIGDIITRIGTTDVTSSEDVFSAVRGTKVGSSVAIVVARGGKTLTLHATPIAQ